MFGRRMTPVKQKVTAALHGLNPKSNPSLNSNPDFSPPESGDERKLEFLVQPVAVTKVTGSSVLLPCVIGGYPAPYVRWMLGDKLLEER